VLASGSVEPSRSADWLAAESWYDQVYASRTPLLRQVTVAGAPAGPALSISAIWTGESPHIVARNGETFGIGATIDGSWKILRIDGDGVLLERNGHTMTLTF
jgi:type III secretion protein D